MPRHLPWLKAGNTATKKPVQTTARRIQTPPTSRTASSAPPKPARVAVPNDDEDDDDTIIEGMRPSDDAWIMVEDEFLSTAQLFTKSLHIKEYEKLKLAATSRNASQIDNIQRTMREGAGASQLSIETLKKREIAAKRLAQRRVMKRIENGRKGVEDSDDDGDGLEGASGMTELGTLMRGTTADEFSLAKLLKPGRATTRAAAGSKNSGIVKREAIKKRPKPPPPPPSQTPPVPVHKSVQPPASVSAPPLRARRPMLSLVSTGADTTEDECDLDAAPITRTKSRETKTSTSAPAPPKSILKAQKPLPPPRALSPDPDDLFSFNPPMPALKYCGRSMAARKRAASDNAVKSDNVVKNEPLPPAEGRQNAQQDYLKAFFAL
ncbi:hypothetical protein EDC01DRAFT_642039 [Geopyxis carbonaria]|nr:hypothetical protein EDC01DRAFT_642039 [Geopyxis carbonaria]